MQTSERKERGREREILIAMSHRAKQPKENDIHIHPIDINELCCLVQWQNHISAWFEVNLPLFDSLNKRLNRRIFWIHATEKKGTENELAKTYLLFTDMERFRCKSQNLASAKQQQKKWHAQNEKIADPVIDIGIIFVDSIT